MRHIKAKELAVIFTLVFLWVLASQGGVWAGNEQAPLPQTVATRPSPATPVPPPPPSDVPPEPVQSSDSNVPPEGPASTEETFPTAVPIPAMEWTPTPTVTATLTATVTATARPASSLSVTRTPPPNYTAAPTVPPSPTAAVIATIPPLEESTPFFEATATPDPEGLPAQSALGDTITRPLSAFLTVAALVAGVCVVVWHRASHS